MLDEMLRGMLDERREMPEEAEDRNWISFGNHGIQRNLQTMER